MANNTNIILRRSSVAARVPTTGDLNYGELAINYQDCLLYFKTASNVVRVLANGNNVPSSYFARTFAFMGA